jgi:hypothetical protein
MTTLAITIIDSMRLTLIDADAVTWTDDELLGYLNEGERTACFLKPDAYTLQEYIDLVAGTLQRLPEDGLAVFDVLQNDTGLRTIEVDKQLLDANNFSWGASAPQAEVDNWASDPRTPRLFYNTPPNDGTGSLLVSYGAVPPVMPYITSEINLPDSYQWPLACFGLARAYAKNSLKQDLTKSAFYMQQFQQMLGVKSQGQVAVAPRVSTAPGV